MRKAVLCIAGTDPTGGAGIQADLQVLARCGVHGMAVPTALIEQDSRGVKRVHSVFPSILERQLLVCFEDAPPDAIKLGALATDETVRAVVRFLHRYGPLPVVLDPVLQASGGEFLLERRAWGTLRDELLPEVTLITPNLAEAGYLAGVDPPVSLEGMEEVARKLLGLGAPWVLLKGGHLAGEPVDLLVHKDESRLFRGKRFEGKVHGTGCALSSTIAAGLALGLSVPEAASRAHAWVQAAIARSEQRGKGRRTLDYGVPFQEGQEGQKSREG